MADDGQAQLDFIMADLNRFTARETVALALDVQANLQEDTPRDTGWARANWVPSVGAPFIGSAELPHKPTTGDVMAARERQQEGLAELGKYTLERGIIFTTNNVPYINRLNSGWSPQAGSAFVQRSVERAYRARSSS